MKKMCAGTVGGALILIGALQGCEAQVGPGYEGEALTTLKGRVSAPVGAPADTEVGVLWLADEEGQCSGPQQVCSYGASGAYSPDADPDCIAACGAMPECAEVSGIEQWESCQQACGVEIEVDARVEYEACFTGGVGQTAPVTGDFPAQFSLDVLALPPPEALLGSDTGERVALGFFVALQPGAAPLRLSRNEAEPPAWLLGGSETHVLIYAADPIAADSTWGSYLGGEYSVGYHLVRVVPGTRCGLPRLLPEDFEDAPDSDGTPHFDTSQGDSEQAPGEPLPELEDPDYRGTPMVCGNAVCDEGETCDVCSDCIACEGSAPGMSSGSSNREGDYYCLATADSFAPAPLGTETEIELLIAPPRLIEWPSF